MADLWRLVGANIDDIAKGMGLDQRIGKSFFILVLDMEEVVSQKIH